MRNIDCLYSKPARIIHASNIPYIENGEIGRAICMHLGLPDPITFPTSEIFEILSNRETINWKQAFQYSECAGHINLRSAILKLIRRRGIKAELDEIFISNGASEGFDLIPQLFINPGDVIYVENPSYPWALRSFLIYNARIEQIRLDESGIDIEQLANRVKTQANSSKLIYIIPNFHNPTGVTLDLDRRKELIDIANKYDLIIIEDDPYYNLRYEGSHLPSLYEMSNERVIHLGTFSKSIGGGVRLGWILASSQVIKKLVALKHTGTNTFMCEIISKYIEKPIYINNLIKIRNFYRDKFEAIIALLKKYDLINYLYFKPEGGFYLWMRIPLEINAEDFYSRCSKANIYIFSGKIFSQDPSMEQYYRISFSYESLEKIEMGMKFLARLYK